MATIRNFVASVSPAPYRMTPYRPIRYGLMILLIIGATVGLSAQYSTIQGGRQLDTTASGDWRGTVMSAQGLRFEMLLHVTVYIDGPCQVQFDVIDQQQYGRRFSSCSFENGRILLNVDSSDASFEGQIIPEEMSIVGTWRQSRTTAPVRFRKVVQMRRTQEPSGSETFNEQPFTATNRAAGVILGGTLVMPTGSGPFPIFVFASDRGHQDRNATDPTGHRPFLVMAHYFAQQGWASLRLDDRGVGASTGTSAGSIEDQVTDLVTVVDRLQTMNQIMSSKIVFLGHGDGGIVATVAARRRPEKVAAVICAGTPSVDGSVLITDVVRASDELYGVDDEIITVAGQLVGRWYDVATSSLPRETIVQRIVEVTDSVLAIHGELLSVYPAAVRLSKPDRAEYISAQLLPWLYSYADLNAPQRLLPTPVPTLVLLADRDVITPYKSNRTGWRSIAARSNLVDIQQFRDMNHGFQSCDDCTAEEAARTPETVAPEVLRKIVDWAKQRLP